MSNEKAAKNKLNAIRNELKHVRNDYENFIQHNYLSGVFSDEVTNENTADFTIKIYVLSRKIKVLSA